MGWTILFSIMQYNITTYYDLNNKHEVELSPFWQCQQKLKMFKLLKQRSRPKVKLVINVCLMKCAGSKLARNEYITSPEMSQIWWQPVAAVPSFSPLFWLFFPYFLYNKHWISPKYCNVYNVYRLDYLSSFFVCLYYSFSFFYFFISCTAVTCKIPLLGSKKSDLKIVSENRSRLQGNQNGVDRLCNVDRVRE